MVKKKCEKIKQKNLKINNENKENIGDDKAYALLPDKPITNPKEDFIGVDVYVDTLKEAIKNDCNIISISSGYGGGKSSICSLLAKSPEYENVSIISLWDVPLENKEKERENNSKKQQGEIVEVETKELHYKTDLISFYKSFLFQLAADYSSSNYARYINKALNKSVGLVGIYLKRAKILKYIFLACIFVFMYFLFDGIDYIGWEWLHNISKTIQIDFNSKIFKYCSLGFAGLCFFPVIKEGKVLYSSWKAEKNRVVTIEDVVLLYSEIITDSISADDEKKSLIIIEDIDRCIDIYGYELIKDFIKGVVKLRHYDCKDKKIRNKLNKMVFIFCLDENKIIQKNNSEEILKIFDYRMDIGMIHFENYKHILNELINKTSFSDEQREDIQILLDNDNNNIRLLKNEINDCILKYNLLEDRYKEKNIKIDFKGCVAYSYLKNNFPNDFNKLISSNISRSTINEFLEKNKIETHTIKISSIENDNFLIKLTDFFRKQYLDEQFALYIYNYPKNQKYLNVNEWQFKQYIKNLANLDLENNKKLSKEYIIEVASENNRLKRFYPDDVIFDPYVLQCLLSNREDKMLQKLFSEKLLINSSDNILKSISFLDFCINNNIDRDLLLSYFDFLYKNWWFKKGIISEKDFYVFREKLVVLLKDKVLIFPKLFTGDYESIKMKEYNNIIDKSKIYELINRLKFNEDLEDIIPDISQFIDLNQCYQLCLFWSKNIKQAGKYINFAIDVLEGIGKFDQQILSSLSNYRIELHENKKFSSYFNYIISVSSYEQLITINSLNICFGLSQESVMQFLRYNIGKTPLIYLLYNQKYNEIAELEFDFYSSFSVLKDARFDYLKENIINFKKFIIYESDKKNFDYLFDSSSYGTFNFSIEWKKVKNIHLLVILNKEDLTVVNDYISNVVITAQENLQLLLEELYYYVSISSLEKYDVLVKILVKYSEICSYISNESDIFDKFISKCSIPYKYRIIIYYLIYCKKIDSKYCSMLKNYNGEEKIEYAEYINSLQTEKIDDAVIDSLNVIYPFNDIIVDAFKLKNMHKYVISSEIMSNKKNLYYKSVEQISLVEFIQLFDYSENFKISLLADVYASKKIIEYNFLEKIHSEELVKAIEKCDYNSKVLKNYFASINENLLIKTLLLLKNVTYNSTSKLINVLSNLNNCINVISNNEKLYNHLYNEIDKNYRSSFTRKFKKRKVIA